ncbi:MAG TPA: PIG-L family deacetylase [Longimicrobiales bacterium]|nr:PIG-L family deacetylase [Longimicrobiales bacterium]
MGRRSGPAAAAGRGGGRLAGVLGGSAGLVALVGAWAKLLGPSGGEAGPTVPAVASSPSVDVYIGAHADDWMLFVGDRAYASLLAARKTLFVYVTAGDAGGGAAYWTTRERAARAGVDAVIGPGGWTCRAASVRAHLVQRCTKDRAVSYFLRLPDGNSRDGLGHGRGSLPLLRDRGTPATALDGSATYRSWRDLYETVGAIVDAESAPSNLPTVHAPDTGRSLNPADHPDHWAAGDAVAAAAAARSWQLRWSVDYHTHSLPSNLGAARHAAKVRVFGAYDDVMRSAGFESYRDAGNYRKWLWRTYVRGDPPASADPQAASLPAPP